ncbi:MAG: hypothetical protein H8K07_01505 [Nitrospira sp.]|nr:hypothetical protein [Nitrospira sp.]
MSIFTCETELQRANLEIAWSFAHRMTSEHFAELCRVTLEHLREEPHADEETIHS